MISGRLKMSSQTVVVDGQALMIDDVCRVARKSDAVRLCDAPDFINRIKKRGWVHRVSAAGIVPLYVIRKRSGLRPL